MARKTTPVRRESVLAELRHRRHGFHRAGHPGRVHRRRASPAHRPARHAAAAALFENGAAGRLVAAVAEQCAALYSLAAIPQDVIETLTAYGERYRIWQTLVGRLARLKAKDPDVGLTTNLFTGLFAAGELQHESDLEQAWAAWLQARGKIRRFYA